MEAKEKGGNQAKPNSSKTKMVVLKRLSDGTAEVSAYDGDDEGELEITLVKGQRISTKTFETVPKRLEFFFEKGFKP